MRNLPGYGDENTEINSMEFERYSCQTKGEATHTAWCGYCVKPNQKGLDTKLVQTPNEKQLWMKHIPKKERKNHVSHDHSENQSFERACHLGPAGRDVGFQRHRLSPYHQQSNPCPPTPHHRFSWTGQLAQSVSRFLYRALASLQVQFIWRPLDINIHSPSVLMAFPPMPMGSSHKI